MMEDFTVLCHGKFDMAIVLNKSILFLFRG